MTPAQDIQAETRKLELQITELMEQFEQRTGAFIQHLVLQPYAAGGRRFCGSPLQVEIETGLPPMQRELSESQSRPTGA